MEKESVLYHTLPLLLDMEQPGEKVVCEIVSTFVPRKPRLIMAFLHVVASVIATLPDTEPHKPLSTFE